MTKIIANLSCALITFVILMGILGLTDPTKPPHAGETGDAYEAGSVLTAIFIYPTYRIAIINGEAKKVGDTVNAFTITTINQNTVELIGLDHQTEILTLVQTPVRYAH